MKFSGTLSVLAGLSLGIGLASCSDNAPTDATGTSPVSKPYGVPTDAERTAVTFSDKAKGGASLMSLEGSILLNGGFEEGAVAGATTFQDWSVYNGGNGFYYSQTGTTSPQSGYAVPAPPGGSFAAMSDQSGGGTHILYQDVTIPASGADLEFDLFIGNRAGVWYSPDNILYYTGPNQQFRVDVVDPTATITDLGAAVLANIYQTGGEDAFVMEGYTHITASLEDFAGQTIRLRFTEVDNQFFFQAGIDNVAVYPSVIEVEVDIKPGSSTNPVNMSANGSLPVAILTTDDFDASTIDAETVRLGTTAINANRNGVLQYSIEDVDGDGDLDFVAHFSIPALVASGDLVATTTSLTITGTSDDGDNDITGSDIVTVN